MKIMRDEKNKRIERWEMRDESWELRNERNEKKEDQGVKLEWLTSPVIKCAFLSQ